MANPVVRVPMLHALALLSIFILALVALVGIIVADERGRKVPDVLANVVMLTVGAIIGFLVRLPTNGRHQDRREEEEHAQSATRTTGSGPAVPQQK